MMFSTKAPPAILNLLRWNPGYCSFGAAHLKTSSCIFSSFLRQQSIPYKLNNVFSPHYLGYNAFILGIGAVASKICEDYPKNTPLKFLTLQARMEYL